MTEHITFRDGLEVLTLWVEKTLEEGWKLGWCPERQNNMVVHPDNILIELTEEPVA